MQKFIIVIPAYNAADYIGRCLDSVLEQEYKNFEIIVIDDHSIDKTWKIIENYPVNSYHQEYRLGSGLANIVKGIQLSDPYTEDVIVTLDGDDQLADRYVLRYLSEVYKEDIWMTYGQYYPESGDYNNFCKPVSDTQGYRKSGKWMTSHLRTFKYWLWRKIDNKDLRDASDKYYCVAWDRAFMYPLIEMAGRHCKFIDKILYIYNDLNPLNDMKLLPDESEMTALEIIEKQIYKQL